MKLVLIAHSVFLPSRSMPRYCELVASGMKARGHEVEVWQPTHRLQSVLRRQAGVGKWLGYIDQYLLYPRTLRRRVAAQPANTLFVFLDQALGMWVPHVSHRPHVIHCHDFLALRSARGEFPENPTKWSGRKYQELIRQGFSAGRNFISISRATQTDLHRFLPHKPSSSEVVYNELNFDFEVRGQTECDELLKGLPRGEQGAFFLHVGGNQWYKNRVGVIEIYAALAKRLTSPPPLWLVGAPPTAAIRARAAALCPPASVNFITKMDDYGVRAAYCSATALIFPSYGEGFGWPIVEAMSCGCPVLTTDEAPMNEIGGTTATYIGRRPLASPDRKSWAETGANALLEIFNRSDADNTRLKQELVDQSKIFKRGSAIQQYEAIYQRILKST